MIEHTPPRYFLGPRRFWWRLRLTFLILWFNILYRWEPLKAFAWASSEDWAHYWDDFVEYGFRCSPMDAIREEWSYA
jgi:hypothetical protein